ncbi:hypothetical protein Lal_00045230 [Lupinus albus]|nr:hypothetical protein Lal_00045230 [Lupinus albus]
MPDRHLDQRDEGIKIFDLDLEEQAKNLLHAKCVMVPDKLTTRCPHFSVGPARTGTRTTWIRHGLFLTRSNFPHRHGKTHQHAWESLLGRWEGAPWHAILTHQGVPGILFINISQSYVHATHHMNKGLCVYRGLCTNSTNRTHKLRIHNPRRAKWKTKNSRYQS